MAGNAGAAATTALRSPASANDSGSLQALLANPALPRTQVLRTAVQHVEHELPPCPSLSKGASKRETESSMKLRPLRPSSVAVDADFFSEQLQDFLQQLRQAAPPVPAVYPLRTKVRRQGVADSEGGINNMFQPIGELLEDLADANELGRKPSAETYFSWTALPRTSTLAAAIELAITMSESLGIEQLEQQQHAVAVAAANAEQELGSRRREQALQAATHLLRMVNDNSRPASGRTSRRTSAGSSSSSRRTSDDSASSSSRRGSAGQRSSQRCMYDTVMRVHLDDDDEHTMIIMLGELKSRQKLVVNGSPLNLVDRWNDGNVTVQAMLSQVWTYMCMLCLKYAFLSCYECTWLARVCPQDSSRLLLSAPVTATSTQPSALLALAWLLSRGVPSASGVIQPRPPQTSEAPADASGSGRSNGDGSGGDGRNGNNSGTAAPGPDDAAPGTDPGQGSRHAGARQLPPTSGATRRTGGGISKRQHQQQQHEEEQRQEQPQVSRDTSFSFDQGALTEQQQQPPEQQLQDHSHHAVKYLADLPIVDLAALGITRVEELGSSCTSLVLRGCMGSDRIAAKMTDATYEGIDAVLHEAGVLGMLGAAGAPAPRLRGVCLTLHGAVACLCSSEVEGTPLSSLERPLPQPVITAAMQAVQAVHAASIMHGDLRLDHLMMQHDAASSGACSVVVLDFGNAAVDPSAEDCAQELLQLHEMLTA